ncbi:MAG: hypothetical protein IJX92_06465 [Clostridia bacterium]|nr:hypothetical protein [Clostridia bacterium]
MNYKTIIPEGKDYAALVTELRYAVASARASGEELVIINIPDNDDVQSKKTKTLIIRILKTMKKEGLIQFYATGESFESLTTEARFLLNKYPQIISDSQKDSADILYAKI